MRPGPSARPQAPCSQTAAEAASKTGMPCAARPETRPASTSPEPAVASQGGRSQPIGRAAVRRGDHRVGPLDEDRRAHETRRRPRALELVVLKPDAARALEQARELPLMRGQHDLMAAARDKRGQPLRFAGEAHERVGVEHDRSPLGGPSSAPPR